MEKEKLRNNLKIKGVKEIIKKDSLVPSDFIKKDRLTQIAAQKIVGYQIKALVMYVRIET